MNRLLIAFLSLLAFAGTAFAQDDEPADLGSESCPITEMDAEAGDWGYEPEDWFITNPDGAYSGGGDGDVPGETEPGTQTPPAGEPACIEKVTPHFLKIVYLGCTTSQGKAGKKKCWKYRDDYTYHKPANRTSACPKNYSAHRYSCSVACWSTPAFEPM
jgi:hypothetical protein